MMMPTWLERVGFLAACLLIPIAWGWLVNWLFGRWHRRGCPSRREQAAMTDAVEEEDEFIDYSI